MAQRKPTHDQLWTITAASREYDIPRETVRGAVDKGHIPSYPTADGTPLVRLQDIETYIANRPKRGRPRES